MLLLLAVAGLTACDPDKKDPDPTPIPPTNNVFVLNEGQFLAGDGAVSHFNRETKALILDTYGAANNGAALGDVVQSMGVAGNRGYVVVNNSNKIEVVNLPDFKAVATIRGLSQPRYFVSTSASRGYVTEWQGSFTNYLPGRVTLLDLGSNTVAMSGSAPRQVTVGRNPEQPVAVGGNIYVPNSLDNTVSVISDAQGAVTNTITVADGPRSMVEDKNGNIWVLCSGFVTYLQVPPYTATRVSAGTLIRFSPNSPTTQFRLTFPTTAGPSNLRINPAKDQLYYSFGGAQYQMPITATALPTTPFIRRSFSGFGIDPRDNTIYGGISTSYNTNGRFIRYQANGTAIDSFAVKIGPNGFVFY
ncbi:hypothetical protein GCM10023185_19940 [Hymenobacter saemangeumensis]|uniref:YncE family protein n=2 Tax=Hymenobacter saemangeumensis TaxID=1084522 RepID=A0ABP8ID81_9BACT